MNFFDILFTLDGDGCLCAVRWGSDVARETYERLFEGWIERRRTALSVFPLPAGQDSGTFQWEEDTFHFYRLPAAGGSSYLLLQRENHREFLFARALDQISEGIQIYDKNACAVYFNRASREISHIPSGIDPAGSHLLDLYNLDENTSTTITALRTRLPVSNRVDRFQSSGNEASIASANTSYPILKDGELLGAVVFEQTEEIARANIQRLEETQKALNAYSSLASRISFSGYTFRNVIGESEKLRAAVSVARKIAPQDCSVLLVGETGTGKEIFAQSIHRSSPRSGKKFLAVNCAAVPDAMIEPLLFGSRDGEEPGYFELAQGGTLFLDELNSMSLAMQSKLLRAIQDGGEDGARDVRILSSCSEDPFRAIAENRLRRDLFYRLSTVMIELPPLRERPEDLEELVKYHLEATSFHFVHSITSVDPQVYEVLRAYDWPGNVRELFHVIDYAQNVSDSATLRVEHLPAYLTKNHPSPAAPPPAEAADFSHHSLQELVDNYERQLLLQALERCGGNVSRASGMLGMLRQSLQYRMRKHGIAP